MKQWKPKRTYLDIIRDYADEVTEVNCDNDHIYLKIRLNYDNIPDDIADDDLKILVDKLNDALLGGNFSIVPRGKFTNG